MDLMVKYYIFLVLQACAIVSSVVLQESSGHTISPSASFYGVRPIIEGSRRLVTQETQITSNLLSPTSQPNASPHFESASGPQANNGLKPPLNESLPSKDPSLLPDAAAPSTSIPEGSPPSPPVIPPTTPVSMPPIPQPEKGPDTTSPANPPTASVQIAPPPKEALQNSPPVAQVAPSMSQVPPSIPQVPSSMPEGPPFIVPEPVASPPTKLPMASPPTRPTLPISPPNLPLPAELPPSTLPSLPPSNLSGHTISPFASFYGVPPIIEGSHHLVTQETQITSNLLSPTSEPNASPHFESASGPQPNNGLKPPLNEPPPSKDPGLLPDAAAPVTSISEGSPPSPPVIPPTTPVSVPPIPQQEKGPDTTSPANPPTASVQTPPPKETLHNPPPVAQVAPSMSQVPPSIPQVPSSMPEGPPFIVPEPVASPPTKLPTASPPTKLPMASPPTRPTLPISLPNLPLPAELSPSTLPSLPPSNLSAPLASPPSTLPRNAPPTPPTPTIPPPNFPAPLASPPSTLPRNTPPSPPTPTAPPPDLPDPLASPPSTLPKNAPPTPPTPTVPPPPNLPAALASPPSTLPRNTPPTSPPTLTTPPPNLPAAPLASPPSTLPRNIPPSPPTLNVPPPNMPAPLASPPSTLPRNSPPSSPLTRPPPSLPVPVASPPYASQRNLPPPHTTFAKSPSIYAVPPSNSPKDLPPINSSKDLPPNNSPKDLLPRNSPKDLPPRNSPKDLSPSNQNSSAPHIQAPIPSTNEGGNQTTNIAPTHRSREKAPIIHKAPSSYNHAPPPNSSYEPPPPTKSHPPPSLPPLYPPPPPGPKSKPRRHNPLPPPGPESNPEHHAPPPQFSISPSISPSVQTTMPVLSPKVSPSRASSPRISKPVQALPPPPPNEDCLSITCVEPLTNTPPGTPCNCVLPMQLELGLGVSIYTFFPLVSELAFEIAAGVFMRSSQVRIMGANEDTQDPEKTIVIVNLVPLGEKFDNFTALVTAQRLWSKQVPIKSSLFGDYEVLFVKYPGLPPSPPSRSSSNGMNGGPYGRGNNGRDVKPLGVDVSKQRRSNRLNGGIIAIIALSVVVAVVLVGVTVWVLLFKRPVGARSGTNPPPTFPRLTKSSGVGGSITGSGPESASLSFRSSIAYTGSAKTFSSSDMEKATDNFNESGVLGEGGFGRVYSGVLEDGTKVAVKVLKRDDQQGGREFLAEVEMLSRLHHRNLVRLIGICTEERNRCLVYELIPNGSVESHLHGVDKEIAPLDWGARLKIALGAARGLAYLHEDSSPRVIHRDFKSSNILLEHDFTPKVSDFGLARTALDEDNRHISTRVMGTFGYVAPEYAMTGHLLVKSDVYSYGVVLLELLSGRKPVDMSMPSGQENLVAWARPLLPTPEGLNLLIDPSLSPEVPFDSIAKVSAIASMCVQPEVSHRPFMGEVVQALKLVCNECEETRDLGSRSCSQEDLTFVDFDPQVSTNLGPTRSTYPSYESPLDVESGFSTSGFGQDVDSYRMSSSSGPLRPQRRPQLWERMKRFSSGSLSDYGDFLRLLSRSR